MEGQETGGGLVGLISLLGVSCDSTESCFFFPFFFFGVRSVVAGGMGGIEISILRFGGCLESREKNNKIL